MRPYPRLLLWFSPAYALVLVLAGVPAQAAQSALEQGLSRIRLPPGFSISLYARVPRARSMAYDPQSGTVFVGTQGRAVYAVTDRSGDRHPDRVVRILDGLKVPNGVAFHRGYLYVAEQNRITRYRVVSFKPGLPWDRLREVAYDKLPDLPHHGWRYLAFGPGGKLYVTVGSPCNVCQDHGIEGTIVRMNPDGTHATIYARGIRNSVGMAFQPGTGTLFFTDNNVDNMGDDIPPGELNAAPKEGMDFGFPWYGGGHVRTTEFEHQSPPHTLSFPVVEFQAHTANLGVCFYTGSMFPAAYRGDAFVAQHGSWNRRVPVGYRIERVHFDSRGRVLGHEVFAAGWLEDGRVSGRPVDLLQLPDGSLLVSDDYRGAIYRITYTRP